MRRLRDAVEWLGLLLFLARPRNRARHGGNMKKVSWESALNGFAGFCLMVTAALLVFTLPLLAQTTAPAAPGIKANLPAIIVGLSAAVFSILQLVKQFLPIKGWVVIALNVLLSVVGSYAAAPPDSVLSLSFLGTAVLASLGASGIWAKYQVMKPAPAA
jgi:hypothetical protein